MAAHEVGELGVEVETQERVPGVAEHHDEGHQGALGTPDGELSEVGPVDLGLLAGQGAQTKVRFARTMWTQLRDAVAEVVRPAWIAACVDHVEQPRGGQRRERLQRLGGLASVWWTPGLSCVVQRNVVTLKLLWADIAKK